VSSNVTLRPRVGARFRMEGYELGTAARSREAAA
jgi:hypothetical protein